MKKKKQLLIMYRATRGTAAAATAATDVGSSLSGSHPETVPLHKVHCNHERRQNAGRVGRRPFGVQEHAPLGHTSNARGVHKPKVEPHAGAEVAQGEGVRGQRLRQAEELFGPLSDGAVQERVRENMRTAGGQEAVFAD